MKHHSMKFNNTINVWDEAIPLGNGALGCLIWGHSDALRLSVDRCDIWDCTEPPVPSKEYSYKSLVDLSREGKIDEIRAIFNAPYSKPAPTKLPAGKIIVDLGVKSNVESELDIENAKATIKSGNVCLESFLDASESKLGYIKINSSKCDIKIENPEFGIIGEIKPEEQIPNSLKTLHYERANKVCYDVDGVTYKYFTQKISDDNTYGLFLAQKVVDGVVYAVYTVERGNNAHQITDIALEKLTKALNIGFEETFKTHLDWWKNYWSESYIELNDDAFFEQNWYLSNYFLGSCSRKGYFPMPLQGVWTADDGEIPPWKGDYHHDLNTELSYYSYLKANHLEEGESFIDYVLSLENIARNFAKNFYAADEGLCIPGCMDIDGNALGGWPMYSFSPVNCAWLCRGLADYYDYTHDEEYLKEKAYPFAKEYGKFLLCLLKENADGKLVLPISSSPEIHDDNKEAYLTPNSTYDLSLMKRLFIDLAHFADILGYGDDKNKWEDVSARFDDIPIDTDGTLMLARDERLLESHRHFSHMMAIHPLKLIRYDTPENKRIIDASLEDNAKLGHYYYVGYSFTWRAELYAVQRNGEKAHEALDTFWNYYCLPNGFHCNGDYKDKLNCNWTYRPFTLEGNMCAADALQEMLLQDIDNKVVICPAVPDKWNDYSFKLRSSNGVIVTVKNNNDERKVILEAYRDTSLLLDCSNGNMFDIELKKGESVRILNTREGYKYDTL